VRHIGLMGEELSAYLNTLYNLDRPQFHAIEKALRHIVPSITRIEVEPNDMGEVELKLVEGDTPIPSRVVSEGTLRVLGLLALGGAKEPPALIGFEEPENGIHPRRIQLVAEVLQSRASKDTQVIVTTHSPILPDQMPDESLMICQKKEGRTEIRRLSHPGEFWRGEEVQKAWDHEELTVYQRTLRGDFDA